MEAESHLLRPADGTLIAGVCAALARRYGVDVTLIRLAWTIAALCFGAGLLVYIICWIVIPEEDAVS
ncbi:MAG: PspC domain-containing protein [Planctomycetota bacterium]